MEYWGSAKLRGRENAYMLPVPRALAKTLGLKAGDVLGMMVVLSDMAPAAKGSLILERIPSVRGKRARRVPKARRRKQA
ncbi:MAG: hypothetical protein AAB153_00635 [Pseudomonadota bacterium]